MSPDERASMRDAIIEAAGELFAAHGMEGVTMRNIATLARANLGSVTYHFTGKEDLYRSVLHKALGELDRSPWRSLVEDAPTRAESAQALADVIDVCVRMMLKEVLLVRGKPWRNRLLMRELIQPTRFWEELMTDIVIPDLGRLVALYRKAVPGAGEREAKIWALTLHAHAVFYITSAQSVGRIIGGDPLEEAFLGQVIGHVAHVMLRAIDLPLPSRPGPSGDEGAPSADGRS